MAVKLVPLKPGQKHKESSFPMMPRNHIIALGLHNQMNRKYFFVIISLNDDIVSGHLLRAFSVFPHWYEPFLRGKDIRVSPLCLQTALCCVHDHPSAESGSTLRSNLQTLVVWMLFLNYFWFFSFQKDGMIALFPPPEISLDHMTCYVQRNVNRSD